MNEEPQNTQPSPSPENSGEESDSENLEEFREQVVETLKTCYDPEIPVNIYELGLIYEVDLSNKDLAVIKMTLTSPACPVAGTLPVEVEQKVRSLEPIPDAKVELVWEPPWTPELMTDAAKLKLNMF